MPWELWLLGIARRRTRVLDTPLVRVAAVMTVFNRVEMTMRCLRSLDVASAEAGVPVSRVVVDDASTDGTWSELQSIKRRQDIFVRGDGQLYWAGGMKAALSRLDELEDYLPSDYLLLLNDDVCLYSNALTALLGRAVGAVGDFIVGKCVDPYTREPTYGGYLSRSRWRPLTLDAVRTEQDSSVDVMNCNIVLTRWRTFREVGGLRGGFTHGLADFDLAMRATRAGYRIILTGEPLGDCARNPVEGTWRDPNVSLRKRVRHMLSPKGLPPAEWARFCLPHAGVLAIPYLVEPWMIVMRPPHDYKPYV
jgi:GT2 family glycosyltransferase